MALLTHHSLHRSKGGQRGFLPGLAGEYKRFDQVSKAASSSASHPMIREMLKAISEMEPKFRAAFIKAIGVLDAQASDDLTALLADGDLGGAISLYPLNKIKEALRDYEAQLIAAVYEGAQAAANGSGIISGMGGKEIAIVLADPNPAVEKVAQDIVAERVAEVSSSIQSTIVDVITNAVTSGRNPIDAARDIRTSIGLTDHQNQIVKNYRTALEQLSPNALTRALRDKRSDSVLARAIENQQALTPGQIDGMVERYRKRWLKYRSETIARTETIKTLNAGNHALFQSYINSGQIMEKQVRRFWHYTADGKTRDEHVAVPSMNKLGVSQSEPFKTPLGPLMYPGDSNGLAANVINCRCTVFSRIISAELLQEAPADEWVKPVNDPRSEAAARGFEAEAEVTDGGPTDLETLLAEARGRVADREATINRLTSDDKPVKLESNDLKAFVSLAADRPGAWRVTFFDAGGAPSGHTDTETKAEALRRALEDGFAPAHGVGSTLIDRMGLIKEDAAALADRVIRTSFLDSGYMNNDEFWLLSSSMGNIQEPRLNDLTMEILRPYFGQSYKPVNYALRVAAAQGTAAPENIQGYADLVVAMLSEQDPFSGTVYRFLNSDNIDRYASLVVGDSFTDNGFASASKDPDWSYPSIELLLGEFGPNIVLEIDGVSGVDVSGFSPHQEEGEVLFKPGTEFTVVRKWMDGNGVLRIKLREEGVSKAKTKTVTFDDSKDVDVFAENSANRRSTEVANG